MSEKRRMTVLLGKTLARLAPLIEEAAKVLDHRGSRVLRNKMERDFHYALAIYGILELCGDDAQPWALAEEIPKSPVLTGEASRPCLASHLRLVVDNGATMQQP
jgi:hypothetical protein